MTSASTPDPSKAESASLPELPQPAGDPESTPPDPDGELRSVPVSYGLWCLALIGLCGMHRLYNRKPLSGLLWLLTFGLCGLGQLVDLVLIPRMVKETPRRALPEAERPPALPGPPQARPGRPTVALPPLDLLREHRQELNLHPFSAVLEWRPVLIRRGLLIGGLMLGGAVGSCVALLIVHQMLRAREAQMAGYEQEAAQLRESIARDKTSVTTLRAANQQLVKRLSDVRSSSALLADLQVRVPEGVQLSKVQMLNPTEMRLEGLARDPVGFGRINAMELTLRRSPLFQATGVTIEKAERVPEKQLEVRPNTVTNTAVPPIKVELPSAVSFQMKANLAPLPANKLVAVMESLKAEGMARRLELLQREGLLK